MNICEKMKKYDQDWKAKSRSDSECTLNDIYRGLVRDYLTLRVLLVTRIKDNSVYLLDPNLDDVNVLKTEAKANIDDLITEGKDEIKVGSYVVTLLMHDDNNIEKDINSLDFINIKKTPILKSSAYSKAFSENVCNFIKNAAGLLAK